MIASLDNVTFRYGRKVIFQNLNGSFSNGEIVGIIGPNGVGKTTLLKLLAGFMHPAKGTVTRNGKCMALIEQPAFYSDLTGVDNLEYFLRRKLTEEERKQLPFHCETLLNLTVRKYSMGMRQKLALCLLFLSDAEILLLDEPTNALDRESVGELLELVKKEKNDRCIVIASHALTELEKIADSVYVISDLKFSDKISIIGTETTAYEIQLLTPVPDEIRAIDGIQVKDDNLLEFSGNREETADLIRRLVQLGASVCEVRKKSSFLETCYKTSDGGQGENV